MKFGIALMLLIASEVFRISERRRTILPSEDSTSLDSFWYSPASTGSFAADIFILSDSFFMLSAVLFTEAFMLMNFVINLSSSIDTLSFIPKEKNNPPKFPLPAIFFYPLFSFLMSFLKYSPSDIF